ncbi:PQQ-dependent sugar dehydrogenase [Nocardia sp. BMG51109]|uniref:PQQ-dependent sugar dehydrogenase n=1 Tax=Nocardia sp. BMG51109 TaxID=1056816 RepID=UPI0004B2E281|nr:PQQ-dependent sugar dehydrogenase [Nocardia sp. BMG51109]
MSVVFDGPSRQEPEEAACATTRRPRPGRIRYGRVALSLAVIAGLLTGCARFDDSASDPFTPAPTLRPEGIQPTTPQAPSTKKRPPGPCEDPDPTVVASCVNESTGVVALPDGTTGVVAERSTGRILLIDTQDPGPWPYYLKQIGQVDGVDASGDGGLIDITLSPTYSQDQLIYAYVTTGSDNRVVRIGADGVAKPILTGIPKSDTGNRGSIEFIDANKMLVLTGDGGSPGAAADPGSLAGKLLELDNPSPGSASKVLASGVEIAGGVCPDPAGNIWFTDRTAVADRLQRLSPDGTVTTAWSWADHPGAAGCVAGPDFVAVAMSDAKAMAMAKVEKDSQAITTAPAMMYQDKWGRLNDAAPGANGLIWASTANKVGGQPTPTDDRVVVISPSGGGGGGPD